MLTTVSLNTGHDGFSNPLEHFQVVMLCIMWLNVSFQAKLRAGLMC